MNIFKVITVGFLATYSLCSMSNEVPVTDISVSGSVLKLEWASQPSQGAPYSVFVDTVDYSTIDTMAARKVVTSGLSTSVAGFEPNTTYYIALVTSDHSGAVQTYPVTVEEDIVGPELLNAVYEGQTLNSGTVIQRNANLSFTFQDAAGVATVKLSVGSKSINLDQNASGEFYWIADSNIDGYSSFSLIATDSLGNQSQSEIQFSEYLHTATLDIQKPLDGTVSTDGTVELLVEGEVEGYQLEVNGEVLDQAYLVGRTNKVELADGTYELAVVAYNADGSLLSRSPAVSVSVDKNLPEAPSSIVATSYSSGRIGIHWYGVSGSSSTVSLYRSISESIDYTASPISTVSGSQEYIDVTPEDGDYYYSLVVNNSYGSAPASEVVHAVSDSVGPEVTELSIYPSSELNGVFGAGIAQVELTVSEALSKTPYLAFTSEGESPIVVAVSQKDTGSLIYQGEVELNSTNFTSGTLYPLFSGMDKLGNRGTVVPEELRAEIDVTGPVITNMDPAGFVSINIDTQDSYQFSITFSESVSTVTAPSAILRRISDGSEILEVDLTSGVDDQHWTYVLDTAVLNVATAEYYEVILTTQDGLGNSISSTAPLSIQLYSGDVPPPLPVMNLTAQSLQAGMISLVWDASEEIVSYQVSRSVDGNTFEQIASDITANAFSEEISSGQYYYRVRSYKSVAGDVVYSDFSETVLATSYGELLGVTLQGQINAAATSAHMEWSASTAGDYTFEISRSTAPYDTAEVLVANATVSEYTDYSPSGAARYYITAIDPAGNRSQALTLQAPDAAIDPLTVLNVKRTESGVPALEWDYVGADQFNVIRIDENGETQIAQLDGTITEYLDASISVAKSWANNYLYRVTPIVNSSEGTSVEVALPRYEVVSVDGDIRRGVFNELTIQIENLSGEVRAGLLLRYSLSHGSEVFESEQALAELPAEGATPVTFVVPGFADLGSDVDLTISINESLTPLAGSSVEQTINAIVQDDTISAQLSVDQLSRGSISDVDVLLTNYGDVTASIKLAQLSGIAGYSASPDIQMSVKDLDGNLLSVQQLTLVGQTNAFVENNELWLQLPPKTPVSLQNVPVSIEPNWPDDVVLEFAVAKTYHSIGESQVSIKGFNAVLTGSLQEPLFTAVVDQLSATEIYADGNTSVEVSGHIVESQISFPISVDLVFQVDGFERHITAVTDAAGAFTAEFTPARGAAGRYVISAVVPEQSVRPEHAVLTVRGAGVSPENQILQMGKNFKYEVLLQITAKHDTPLTGVTAQLEGETTLFVESDAIDVAAGETKDLTITLASGALGSGNLVFNVMSNEFANAIGEVNISYVVSDAAPAVVISPSLPTTGVKVGETSSEQISVTNNGTTDLLDPEVFLEIYQDGQWVTAPSWLSVNYFAENDRLSIGKTMAVKITAKPTDEASVGDYSLRLKVTGSDGTEKKFSVFYKVTLSGEGAVSMFVADNYTGTQDESGNTYGGIPNAQINVQNIDVLSELYEGQTDSNGSLTFENLPAGSYVYEVTSYDHQRVTGEFKVTPGVTAALDLFQAVSNLVVSFDVVETTISDNYEIVMNATYETDVPAAIVIFDPGVIELPDLKTGETFTGELTVTNYGLLKAYGMVYNMPEMTEYARFEYLGEFPTELDPSESYTISYKLTALKDFSAYQEGASTGAGTSETVVNVNSVDAEGFYYCANGVVIFKSAECFFVLDGDYYNTFGPITSLGGTVKDKAPSCWSKCGYGGGSSSGAGWGTSGVSLGKVLLSFIYYDEYYYDEKTAYTIELDGSTYSGCRKLTSRGESKIIESGFTGCSVK